MIEYALKIEFQPVFDKWAWRITYQNEDILQQGFKDKEIGVESCICPVNSSKILFIRGSDEDKDDCINICDDVEKSIIEEKVRAINKKYGFFKLWRAEKNGKYYFVEIQNAKIILTAESSRFLDDERYKIGNYFKTRELAEKYLSDLKKFSRKWHEENGEIDGDELQGSQEFLVAELENHSENPEVTGAINFLFDVLGRIDTITECVNSKKLDIDLNEKKNIKTIITKFNKYLKPTIMEILEENEFDKRKIQL